MSPSSPPDPLLSLLALIVQRRLRPGAAVPSTSTTVLDALQARRMVERHTDATATVSEPYRWNVLDPDVVRELLAGDDAAYLIGQTIDTLRLLLTAAARFAAIRVTPADRDRLLHALTDFRAQITDGLMEEGYIDARIAVYRAITRAAGQQPLMAAAEPLLTAVTLFRFAGHNPREGVVADPIELGLVVDAIVTGDRRAAPTAMAAHLRRLNHRLGGEAG